MPLSTAQLRSVWSPACRGKGNKFLAAYAALDLKLRRYGYRPRRNVTGAYNCRRITGGSGYSLHSYGPASSFTFWNGVRIPTALAVDINWDRNPYGRRLVTDMPRAMITEILAIRTNNGRQVWGWGGYYAGSKDAMHFEIVCSPRDLATGIRASAPTGAPRPSSTSTPEDHNLNDADRKFIKEQLDAHRVWVRAELGTGAEASPKSLLFRVRNHAAGLRDSIAELLRNQH